MIFVSFLVSFARVFEVFLIVLNGVQGKSLWGGNPVRATTLTSESERQSGRLGVWLYSSHTRARVAQGEEREPVSNSQSVSQSVSP